MNVRNFSVFTCLLGAISCVALADDKGVSIPQIAAPITAATADASVTGVDAHQPSMSVSTVVASDPGESPKDTPVVNPITPEGSVKTGVVRVPYIPEVVIRQIKEEIRQEVLAQAKGERWGDPGALPDWLSRISWDGDLRLRYQRDGFPSGNTLPVYYTEPTSLISNTTDPHNYLRVQARLGMKAKISEYSFAAFRLSTGSTTNPVSNNQTLGTGFNKASLVFDRAYFQSTPYEGVSISAGKMPNPWLGTDLVWDADVNFEGVSAQFKQRAGESWSSFFTAGAFPFQDIQRSDTVTAKSKWLYGAQVGTRWTAMNASTAQFGIALYDYRHVEGIPNSNGSLTNPLSNTVAQSMQKGNSLVLVNVNDGNTGLPATAAELANSANYGLASKFRELNVTAKMDWATFDPVHVMLTGDYVKNLGFNAAEIAQRTGLPAITPKVTGYQVGLVVGNPRIKQRGDWQANIGYKYLEKDAVLDALTDSDFHLGGTNAKGYIVGASYGLDKETNVSLRWISTDQIDGPPLAIDTLQVDLSMRF